MCITHAFTPSTTITTKKIRTYKKKCPHNKQKTQCKDCKGTNICIHDKARAFCKLCGGSGICEHNMNQRYCKKCKGTAFCDHSKVRRYCIDCDGSSLCVHKKYNKHCISCSPYPTLSCAYTLCTYQTKDKHAFKTHQKTHTEKIQQRKKSTNKRSKNFSTQMTSHTHENIQSHTRV